VSIADTVNEQMKTAMRAKDKERLAALRFIRAAIIEEQKTGKGDVTDDMIVALMRRMVKQRVDAAATYRQGEREDLAAKEEGEMKVIAEFLPQLADEATTRNWVDEAIAASGANSMREMGKAMGALMKAHKGEVDGKLARQLIQAALS